MKKRIINWLVILILSGSFFFVGILRWKENKAKTMEEEFRACFGASVSTRPECKKYDYNRDGGVGIPDFSTLSKKIDRLNRITRQDIVDEMDRQFKSCFGQSATGRCRHYDFNNDGVIGIPDFAELSKLVEKIME